MSAATTPTVWASATKADSSRLCGHRDLSPDLNGNGEIEPEEWIKECPCFDAAAIVREAAPPNPGCAG